MNEGLDEARESKDLSLYLSTCGLDQLFCPGKEGGYLNFIVFQLHCIFASATSESDVKKNKKTFKVLKEKVDLGAFNKYFDLLVKYAPNFL